MKNKKEFKKWTILIIAVIITYWGINNLSVIGNALTYITKIIFPFILGGFLAFLINIPMSFFEKKLHKIKNKKMLRIISLVLAILVILLIFILIITLIVPELIDIVKMLIDNIPYYAEEINKFIGNYTEGTDIISNINIDTDSIKNEIIEMIPGLVNSSISMITGVIGAISDFVISIIFAMYALVSKEKLSNQCKKMLYAYCNDEKANKILCNFKITQNTFKSFFTVQCLEATILGVLCIIGMLILKIPYAISIGILIGVTALIPIVGAFIGVIVGAILIVSVEPMKVIPFVICILVTQQIEGNFIYPRVVGNSVGLPGMWVLVAVSIGGSLFGVVGMLLAVPCASVIYKILRKDVNEKLWIKEKQYKEYDK